jgi:lysophospholipase L1-like esterase
LITTGLKKTKHTLLFLLFAAVSFFYASGVNCQPAQNDTLLYKKNPNYDLQIDLYEIYKTKQADIVMLGNSLTHGANWNELLGRNSVVERGIPSDVLEGFLHRMQYVYTLKPKICFILGGLNDIYNWIPVEEIYYNYIRIVEGLRRRNIKPVIQSTLYAGKDWGKDWGGTPEINAGRNKEVMKLNKLLKDYAKRNNIDFIDLTDEMSTPDNFMRPDLTWDGVHLNAKGFNIWAKEVDKILRQYNL